MSLTSKQEELLTAFQYGNKEKALGLLKVTSKPEEINKYNWTLLHYAARLGWTDVCQLLIQQYHIDPHCKNSSFGRTALHEACDYGYTETVKYLVCHAHCDPLTRDYRGFTPFDKSDGVTRHFLQEIIG